MSRVSYFIFNILLVIVLYTVAYFSGPKHEGLIYTIQCFSVPYIVLNFFMALYSLFHFFIFHDNDVSKDGITYLHGTWVISLLTFGAYKIISMDYIVKLLAHFGHHL